MTTLITAAKETTNSGDGKFILIYEKPPEFFENRKSVTKNRIFFYFTKTSLSVN